MSRRGENIRKRKDGRWEARYKKAGWSQGKTVYGSVYGDTYREVKEKRQKLLQQQTQELAAKDGCIRFKELLQKWEDNNQIQLKAATVYRYRYLIHTHILPELGELPVEELTGTIINTFINNKFQQGRLDGKGGLSAAYVRSIALVIDAALRFGVSEGMCGSHDFSIKKPALPVKELSTLSRENQLKLEKSLLTDMNGTKLGIYISLYTGLRIGEVCALAWEDIDLKNGIIHVRHTIARVTNREGGKASTRLILDQPKTFSSLRTIPICSKLTKILKAYVANAPSKYVISSSFDFVSPRTYEYRYQKLLKENNIPHINYHVLRHTFATRCIEAGVDVKSLSEMLGHANVAITLNTYVHSSLELKRSQLEKLVSFFGDV